MLFMELSLNLILIDMILSFNNVNFKPIIFVILIFSIVSCSSTNKKEAKELNVTIANNIGKEINIPNDLQMYTPFTNYISDSVQMFNSEFRIYSYINASCGTCVNSIKEWKQIVSEFSHRHVSVILIFKSDDNFELLKYLCEKGEVKNFPYPFFFDRHKKFPELNAFILKHKHLQTILVDKNNKILLFGNPIRSNEIKDLYLRVFKKASVSFKQ